METVKRGYVPKDMKVASWEQRCEVNGKVSDRCNRIILDWRECG